MIQKLVITINYEIKSNILVCLKILNFCLHLFNAVWKQLQQTEKVLQCATSKTVLFHKPVHPVVSAELKFISGLQSSLTSKLFPQSFHFLLQKSVCPPFHPNQAFVLHFSACCHVNCSKANCLWMDVHFHCGKNANLSPGKHSDVG